MGVAVCTWGGGGRGPAQAHCEIASDGSVVMRIGTQDIGTGTRTLVAIVTAESLGLQPSQVKAEIGDTLVRRQSDVGRQHHGGEHQPGDPRRRGQGARRAEGKGRAGAGRRCRVARCRRRPHSRQGQPVRGLSWAEACKHIGPQPIAVDGDWVPGLSSVTTSGVQFAEVTVDIETGIVKLTRILALQDCGLVVSRLTAESQSYGGVIGSLNFAMFEDRILDRNTGQMVNPNMEWYLLAGMSDIPRIDVRLKDQPERGVIGIGEPPTVPTAAAIALAVRNAIGVTLRSLPLTPAQDSQGAAATERDADGRRRGGLK